MIFRWKGGSSTAWATAGNWLKEDGTAHATNYPGDTAGRLDDVYFDTAPTNAVAGATITNALRSVTIGSGCTSDVASSGTYLKFQAESLNIAAAANVYIEGASDPGISNVRITSTTSGKTIYLKGYLGAVAVENGTVSVEGSINTSLVIGSSSDSTAVVTLASGLTALPATVTMNGGTVTNAEAITTLNMQAGTWTQSNVGSTGLGTVTTLNLYGGTYNWNGGNITTANLYGGTFTLTDAGVERRVGTINLYSTATVNLASGLRNIHITDYIVHMGGGLALANATKLAEYRVATYAGASDAVQGISPQVVLKNNTVTSGDIYLAPYDRLDVYCTVGATDVTEVKLEMFNFAVAATYTDEAAIADPAAVTWGATDDNKTKKITLWGYQCAAGKSCVRAKVSVSNDNTSAAIGVVMVKNANQ